MGEERRSFSRVKFDTRAVMSDGVRSVEGQVTNLSLRGAYVLCEEGFVAGDVLDVAVVLDRGENQEQLRVRANVVRATDDGLALQFDLEGIDLDALIYLRHIVAYALGDADVPMNEFWAWQEERKKQQAE